MDVVHGDEIIWTLENNGTLLNIVLPKAEFKGKEQIWNSLFVNSKENYATDPTIFHEMKKKMDLEKFQIEVNAFTMMNFYTQQLIQINHTFIFTDRILQKNVISLTIFAWKIVSSKTFFLYIYI